MSSHPQNLLPLTPLTLQLLVSLMKGPAHGYGLKRDVEERTAGRIRVSAGTLYTGLQRMERDGLIRETDAPPDVVEEASSRWRFYEATDLGRQTLRAELERLEAAVHAVRGALLAFEES
jgi:DNA-binding PadR family transcriptional regulator